MGKGANAIVSMLHHHFVHHGLGETTAHLHADDYGGQNKNATMVHYFLWRVMTGQHDQITLSFMIPGHTGFSPDWCFGLLKKRYRRTKVGRLTDLIYMYVVNQSAVVNVIQPTGSADGQVLVPAYNWQEFFTPHFKKVTGIKNLHHLRFSSASPGCAFVKERARSEEVKRCFFKKDAKNWEPDSDQPPPVLPPAGLSFQCQWYLHDTIRVLSDNIKDICPKPAGEAEGSSPSSSFLSPAHLLRLLPYPPLCLLSNPTFHHPLQTQRNHQLSGHDCVGIVSNQGTMPVHAPVTSSSLHVHM